MLEFLQAYGGWIVLGLFFLLMMRGGGCGMGSQHSVRSKAEQSDIDDNSAATGGGSTRVTAGRSGGGCH